MAYHKGGYLPFTVDITDFIAEDLTVSILISVHDFSDTSYHARGKQQLERGGMFYTAQSGIWQTVWMEIVPDKYIKDIRTTPDYDKKKIRMRVRTASAQDQNAITCRIYPPVFLESEGLTDDLLHEEITSGCFAPWKGICYSHSGKRAEPGPPKNLGSILILSNMAKTVFWATLPSQMQRPDGS